MAKKAKKKAAKKKHKPTPKPQVTATTRYVAFRLPHRTLAAIEQCREWLIEDFGLPVNRTTALVHRWAGAGSRLKWNAGQIGDSPICRREETEKE